MMLCDTCRNKENFLVCYECLHDTSRKDRYKPMTNADHIRSMSDEELASVISSHTMTGACNDWGLPSSDACGGNCEECLLKWLKQPHEVKRGRWIVGLDGSYMCSSCGSVSRDISGDDCPNCGAKMDLEE